MSLIINHRQIDEDLGKILYQLRSELTNGKLKDIIDKGDNYLVTCPFHKGGFERHPSCQLYCGSTKDIPFGSYHCFSCNESGSLCKFIGACLDGDESLGEQWLLERFGDTYVVETVDMPPIVLNKSTEYKQIKREVDISGMYDYHPYMSKRKLTDQVIKEFSIKYDPKSETIVFPVWNENGEMVMLTQRSVNSKQFYIDKGVDKPVYLFNRVKDKDYPFVIITEAQIDALTCWGYGVPACAFIGLGSDKQYEILNRNRIKCWVTMFDNDQAGRDATQRFNRLIRKDLFVINVKIPDGKKDINDLSYEEFDSLLTSYGLTWRFPIVDEN